MLAPDSKKAKLETSKNKEYMNEAIIPDGKCLPSRIFENSGPFICNWRSSPSSRLTSRHANNDATKHPATQQAAVGINVDRLLTDRQANEVNDRLMHDQRVDINVEAEAGKKKLSSSFHGVGITLDV